MQTKSRNNLQNNGGGGGVPKHQRQIEKLVQFKDSKWST